MGSRGRRLVEWIVDASFRADGDPEAQRPVAEDGTLRPGSEGFFALSEMPLAVNTHEPALRGVDLGDVTCAVLGSLRDTEYRSYRVLLGGFDERCHRSRVDGNESVWIRLRIHRTAE